MMLRLYVCSSGFHVDSVSALHPSSSAASRTSPDARKAILPAVGTLIAGRDSWPFPRLLFGRCRQRLDVSSTIRSGVPGNVEHESVLVDLALHPQR